MATRIIADRAAAMGWPMHVRQYVTADSVLNILGELVPSKYVNCRPAIIAQAINMMGDARTGTPEDLLQQAVETLIRKVKVESLVDFTIALQHLHYHNYVKTSLFAFARGDQAVLTHIYADPSHLDFFMRLLSEPHGSGRKLLPPYQQFSVDVLNENGDVLVQYASSRLTLSESLNKKLKFLYENFSTFSPQQRQTLSTAILSALASNGCGILQPDGSFVAISTVQDIAQVAEVHKLIRETSVSVEAREYSEIMKSCASAEGSDAATQDKIADYNASLGLRVLRWIRHMTSHDVSSLEFIAHSGLSPAALESVLSTAMETIAQFGTHDTALKQAGLCFRPNTELFHD
jgi:hypothetical protein